MRHILITGGAGFIGSNFIEYFAEKFPHYHLYNLDLLTYAGNLANLSFSSELQNYTFIRGDICDKALLESLFDTHKIDSIIHFAAQSHVDNSIRSPQDFITANIQGTFTLLDVCLHKWSKLENKIFCHISTDEVFGTLGSEGAFDEYSPYAPNSPYSASKASSDMLVRSYFHTYGLPTLITNCSNNYGPRQHREKLIPTIIHNALDSAPIPIYGDGSNVRDWLYVLDHCQAIEKVFHSAKFGESFAIGGKNEYSNLQIAHMICSILDELSPRATPYADQITFVQDRLGHDKRYAINPRKIESELGWKPMMDFEKGLRKTIEWYLRTSYTSQKFHP